MIKVVAKNFIKEDKVNDAIELYKELVNLTREEEGCIKYELCQDEKDATILTMIEEWENKDVLEKHFNTEHFTRIVPKVKEFTIKDTEVTVYNKVI